MSTASKATIEDEILEMDKGKVMVNASTQTLEMEDGNDSKKYGCDSISSLSSSVATIRPAASELAAETIKQGAIFAKNAKNKYGTPKPSSSGRSMGDSIAMAYIASSIEKAFQNGFGQKDSSVVPDKVPSKVSATMQPVLATIDAVSFTENPIEPQDSMGLTIAGESQDVLEPAVIPENPIEPQDSMGPTVAGESQDLLEPTIIPENPIEPKDLIGLTVAEESQVVLKPTVIPSEQVDREYAKKQEDLEYEKKQEEMKYAVLQQVREFIKDQENSECAKEQENSECAKEQENSECAEEQENREHAQFFSSWGPQIERDTPPAQQRKVVIIGDPEWHSSPRPDFIASLVYGGPLEQIQCLINSAAVTFIYPEDALAFYEHTANGIVYEANAEVIRFAEVRMPIDPTPISSYVMDCFNQGATRSVRAIGVDVVMSINSLRLLAEGKVSFRGIPTRKLESMEDTMNEGGYRVVIFNFCDIRHSIAFKGELMRRWEDVNVQFIPDYCAIATGSRVEVRPITRPF